MIKVPGRRYDSIEELEAARPTFGWAKAKPGEYAYDELGARWYIAVCDEKNNIDEIGRIVVDEHKVIEDDEGALTVKPSLQFDEWHGWLEDGIFEYFTPWKSAKFLCVRCDEVEAMSSSIYCSVCRAAVYSGEEDSDPDPLDIEY